MGQSPNEPRFWNMRTTDPAFVNSPAFATAISNAGASVRYEYYTVPGLVLIEFTGPHPTTLAGLRADLAGQIEYLVPTQNQILTPGTGSATSPFGSRAGLVDTGANPPACAPVCPPGENCVPNDPDQATTGLEWYLSPTPDPGVANGASIGIGEAWNRHRGDPRFLIAVVDNGGAQSSDPSLGFNESPDLADNLWHNPGEIPANGIDDDGNGFVDDVNGWNFVDSSNDTTILPGGTGNSPHGGGIALIAAADTDNGFASAGIMWDASVMHSLYYTDNGTRTPFPLVAMDYAIRNGAQVLNYADWIIMTEAHLDVFASDRFQDCLLVVADGNVQNGNTGDDSAFPARLGLPNTISVGVCGTNSSGAYAVIDHNDTELIAPSRTGGFTTSQAAPVATGVAGLFMSYREYVANDPVTPAQAKQHLLDTASFAEQNYPQSGGPAPTTLGENPSSSGVVNAGEAMGYPFLRPSLEFVDELPVAAAEDQFLQVRVSLNYQETFRNAADPLTLHFVPDPSAPLAVQDIAFDTEVFGTDGSIQYTFRIPITFYTADRFEFYFTAGYRMCDPVSGPERTSVFPKRGVEANNYESERFSVYVGQEVSLAELDFESPSDESGWTVPSPANTGQWQRAMPEPTDLQPRSTPSGLNTCWVTNPGTDADAFSDDFAVQPNNSTQLLSPAYPIDLSSAPFTAPFGRVSGVVLGYERWFSYQPSQRGTTVSNGNSAGFGVDVRVNTGQWEQIEETASGDDVTNSGGWVNRRFDLRDTLDADLTAGGNVQVRFSVDGGSRDGMVSEALVDDFTLIAVERACVACVADQNCDGVVEPADFNSWVLNFNSGNPLADVNGNGQLDAGDFNAWIVEFDAAVAPGGSCGPN